MAVQPTPGHCRRRSVRVATGDGKADIITAAGAGGGPHVKVFDGTNINHLLYSFFAFDATYTGGLFVAAGDLNGDGKSDLVVSQGSTSCSAHVRTFDGATGNRLADFTPYSGTPAVQGIHVGLVDRDSDGLADIITAPVAGSPPQVISSKGTTLANLGQFNAYDPGFLGGVFVG